MKKYQRTHGKGVARLTVEQAEFLIRKTKELGEDRCVDLYGNALWTEPASYFDYDGTTVKIMEDPAT